MNTKGIIGTLIVLGIVAAGVFFLMGRDGTENLPPIDDTEEVGAQNASTQMTENVDETPKVENGEVKVGEPSAKKESATVTYTTDGFNPKSITIKKGESVIFMNDSGRDMWVASAMHPTHSVYPEKSANDCLGSSFDACKGIPTGQSWVFTFTKAGSWGYHNHLSAQNFGTVIVQ